MFRPPLFWLWVAANPSLPGKPDRWCCWRFHWHKQLFELGSPQRFSTSSPLPRKPWTSSEQRLQLSVPHALCLRYVLGELSALLEMRGILLLRPRSMTLFSCCLEASSTISPKIWHHWRRHEAYMLRFTFIIGIFWWLRVTRYCYRCEWKVLRLVMSCSLIKSLKSALQTIHCQETAESILAFSLSKAE